MNTSHAPLDLKRITTEPLSKCTNLIALEKILVDVNAPQPDCSTETLAAARECAQRIKTAREKNASVIAMCGASLVTDGLQNFVNSLMERGYITHLATDCAAAIHDWEFAFRGESLPRTREAIAAGAAVDETSRNIHLAILCGALSGHGFGQSVGQFIRDDGVKLPSLLTLEKELRDAPAHPLSPARAELLRAMTAHKLNGGKVTVKHSHKNASLLANAFRLGVPFTVHPTIGADALTIHSMFRGAAIGRVADFDFRLLGGSVERLNGGVMLMLDPPPQLAPVLETGLACVKNLNSSGAKDFQAHWILAQETLDFPMLLDGLTRIPCAASDFVKILSRELM